MGNICGSENDVEHTNRIETLERRVLELEQSVFLSRNVDERDVSFRKKYQESDSDPEFVYRSNPIICPPANSKANASAPLYVNPEAAHAMSWSR